MEFYSSTKKNEILSFTGKWMGLEKLVRLRRPKTACSHSNADYRPKANAVMLLNITH
jgi:hypothetical protein